MSRRLFLFLMSLLAVVPAALALDAEAAGEAARSAGPYAIVGGGALVIIGTLVYFLPTFISGARRMESFPMVLLIDLLLGWTVIGWVIALLYSIRSTQDETRKDDAQEEPTRRQSFGR